MSIRVDFPKLSKFDRIAEPTTCAVPFPEGQLSPDAAVALTRDGVSAPTQTRPTALWPDGSVKWLLVDALVDLPGNASTHYELTVEAQPLSPTDEARVEIRDDAPRVETGRLVLELAGPDERGLIRSIAVDGRVMASGGELVGPELTIEGQRFVAAVGEGGWRVVEPGPVRLVVEADGKHVSVHGAQRLDFRARITAWAGKPWCEAHYRLINREPDESTAVESMTWAMRPDVAPDGAETAITVSNYRSRTQTAEGEEQIRQLLDAEYLLYTSNEQVPEVNWGTFTGHWRHPERGGLAATIFQAPQNFPKALSAGPTELTVELVPEDSHDLTLLRGMAKGHRFLLHAHRGDVSQDELIVRGLQYQMPDRPIVESRAYREARVLPDLFVDEPVRRVERTLLDLADRRTRTFGMLHWGDAPDSGYTNQGRGRGALVYCNLEYDLPRAALIMFARTGERRMLDYLLVSAEHWMEVDVCHESDDPMRHEGMIVHSACHATGGVTISHEWVEGLLDYYHQTGDEFALETALGVGRNVLRHLEWMMARGVGAFAARETGWAIRSLVALYEETHDETWLEPAETIVGHFEEWMDEHGTWLAPYTDHTLVRVPFMITVAVNGLMCYHRARPEERIERMVVQAMDDLIEHCLMPDGRFYYKELPSLQRRGAGTQVLQGLAHAYMLTGDDRCLRAGMDSFELSLDLRSPGGSGPKYADADAVLHPQGRGPKSFAAYLLPIGRFYRCAVEAGLLTEE
ncbi:MAG: beta-L-arabinofuranosidase domain-containing protein [Armatimonadota bacterium]